MTEVTEPKHYLMDRIAQANGVALASRDGFRKKNFGTENPDN
jgi:hypothetical protein